MWPDATESELQLLQTTCQVDGDVVKTRNLLARQLYVKNMEKQNTLVLTSRGLVNIKDLQNEKNLEDLMINNCKIPNCRDCKEGRPFKYMNFTEFNVPKEKKEKDAVQMDLKEEDGNRWTKLDDGTWKKIEEDGFEVKEIMVDKKDKTSKKKNKKKGKKSKRNFS